MFEKRIGFTFIELILVVIILLVIAGLATPRIKIIFADIQLENFSQNLIQLIRYAQARAIAEGISYQINFDFAGKSFLLVRQKEPASEEFERLKEKAGRLHRIPRGISLDATNPAIVLYPDGKISEINLEITGEDKIYTLTTEGQIASVKVIVTDKK